MAQNQPTFETFAICCALVSTSIIGLATFEVGAGEPPDRNVERAYETAKRAVVTERVIGEVGPDDQSQGESSSAAKKSASKNDNSTEKSVPESAGKVFGELSFDKIPSDWSTVGVDLEKAKKEDGTMVQTLDSGAKVSFTINPRLQDLLERRLREYEVPHGAVAMIEPSTGRVLAMVSHNRAEPAMPKLARRATAPSASVFKIITATALLEETEVSPTTEACYNGGHGHLPDSEIKAPINSGRRCANLREALGKSINSIFGKLAYKHLERKDLSDWARRFGFGRPIPFDFSVEKSRAEIAGDPLERARIAAGFWHTYMSPLHGAMITAAIANNGVMMRPYLIDKVETPNGKTAYQSTPEVLKKVVSAETASRLQNMLEHTTSKGTADRYFAHRPGFPRDIEVGGKTGTLANKQPYLSFSWFVGFGVDGGESESAAIGSLVCNKMEWRIKGPYLASEGFNYLF